MQAQIQKVEDRFEMSASVEEMQSLQSGLKEYAPLYRLVKLEKCLPLYQKIEDAKGASQTVYNRLDRIDLDLKNKADTDMFNQKTLEIEEKINRHFDSAFQKKEAKNMEDEFKFKTNQIEKNIEKNARQLNQLDNTIQ